MRHILIVCLYVDNLIIYTVSNISLMNKFKKRVVHEFEITDLRLMSYFLGLEVKQCNEGIFVSREKYVKDLLERLGMKGCN